MALAQQLGEDWDQSKISKLEAKDTIDDELLEQLARILKVPVQAIKSFDEEKAVQIISNTFNDSSTLNGINYYPTFNPIDKLLEVIDDENKRLYERLITAEKQKVELLEKVLEKK